MGLAGGGKSARRKGIAMLLKKPIPRSEELLDRIKKALTADRLPLLIAIDGADDAGKSSLASWLAWQLGMPAVQLDLYLTSLQPIQWLTADLARVVARRIDAGRPLIIDGVLVLDALNQIGRKANFLIFVTGGHTGNTLAPQIEAYRLRQKLSERADFIIDGYDG
jgi:2-phosphoglycerate kinase